VKILPSGGQSCVLEAALAADDLAKAIEVIRLAIRNVHDDKSLLGRQLVSARANKQSILLCTPL
jgi:hypothetical protein